MTLRRFRADLHVHTCLSPCANNRMRPLAIVRRAREQGLDMIGICDHNSTRNVRAVRRAGEDEGLAVIAGIEICSEEEVHLLGLFDEPDGAEAIQRVTDDSLSGENNADLFGEQHVCDERDDVVGSETKLLLGATTLSVEEGVGLIHRLGGLAIASHVDRESFSLIGQLGFVPEGLEVDALEVSPLCATARARELIPPTTGWPLVRFSDAHRLEELGGVSTTFIGASPILAEFARALRGEGGRRIAD